LEGTEEQLNLSDQIMDAWINFARNGDPNHKGLPKWVKYERQNRSTMFFDVPCKIVNTPREELRLAWEKVLQS
jgi:para-nitrobenzyl esterase